MVAGTNDLTKLQYKMMYMDGGMLWDIPVFGSADLTYYPARVAFITDSPYTGYTYAGSGLAVVRKPGSITLNTLHIQVIGCVLVSLCALL